METDFENCIEHKVGTTRVNFLSNTGSKEDDLGATKQQLKDEQAKVTQVRKEIASMQGQLAGLKEQLTEHERMARELIEMKVKVAEAEEARERKHLALQVHTTVRVCAERSGFNDMLRVCISS